MFAHNATFRVHCHATEEEDRVLRALAFVAGDARPERSTAEGHFGNPIAVFEVSLGRGEADAFWERLRAVRPLAEQLAAEAERRVDERGTVYARFDKQRAFLGEWLLTQGDDAIHLRSKLAAFPAKKGPAVDALRRFLAEAPAKPPKG